MGDSDEDKTQSGTPAGENAPETTNNNDAKPEVSNNNTAATLEQARKFLQDAQVQNESIERKAEFLRGKGIAQHDIERLLAEDESLGAPQSENQEKETAYPRDFEKLPEFKVVKEPEVRETEKKEDHTPIITYPEFLTKPARPPPLVTVNGFLNTVYAFAGLSTFMYGTSKYALEPMVEALTEARLSFHDTAKENLAKLVEKLEGAVSEIPPTVKKADASTGRGGARDEDDDNDSGDYEDPTELFHRDIGVQTSLPPSPLDTSLYLPGSASHRTPGSEDPVQEQTRRVRELATSARDLRDGFMTQSEGYEDVKRVLDVFGEDLDKLTYPPGEFVGGFSLYGLANKNEPDDEIKRAKENIRRVKGVLLSARSFPASVR